MRSIWKGAISFGLVSIPVRLYSATEEKNVAFHQVHRDDGGRIRYRRVCQVDGEEVQYSDIAKGYELASGEVVVLTDEDFVELPLSSSKAVEVLRFVPLEQVDPMYFTRSYYLEPDATGTKPYVLLREALTASGRVAVVKVALRQRESLACMRVVDDVLVLEMMLWPDEIRAADFGFLDEDVSPRKQEVAMAQSLIEAMSGDFEPGEYEDEYRAAVEALIEAKVAGREVVEPEQPEEEGTGTVVDLMAALRASVDAAKRGRGESAGTAASDAGGTAKAAKSRTTKKAPAAKTATKSSGTSAAKTTRKKTAAKKPASASKAPAKKKASRRSA
ncbi:MAG: Ku protein [Actinomycetes bacterium]